MSIEMPTVRYLTPLKSSTLVTGFLNHRAVGSPSSIRERNDVQAERCIQFGQKLLAAAPPVPGQQHVGVHRESPDPSPTAPARSACRSGRPARHGRRRACLSTRHRSAERGTTAPAGSTSILRSPPVMSLTVFGVVESVFVKDILRWPGALKAHAYGALGADNGSAATVAAAPAAATFRKRRRVACLSLPDLLTSLSPVGGRHGTAVNYCRQDKGLRAALATRLRDNATFDAALRPRHQWRVARFIPRKPK